MQTSYRQYNIAQKKEQASRLRNLTLTAHILLLSSYSFPAHMPKNFHTTTLEQCKHMNKAISAGNLESVEQLLTNGYHPDRGLAYVNPLIQAAVWNQKKIAKTLITYGADLNWANEFGVTPFLAAIMFKNLELAQLLLQHGSIPLLNEILAQAINKICTYYERCHTDPVNFQQAIYLHTPGNTAAPDQYALTTCDLLYLQAYQMPHTQTEYPNSTAKRFQQYTKDTYLVLEQEYTHTQTLFSTLAEALPLAPYELIYLILSFESSTPLDYLHRKTQKTQKAVAAIQKSTYICPDNATARSLLHEMPHTLSPELVQHYLDHAKKEILKTTQSYIHYLCSSKNIEAKELKNPLGYLRKRLDEALQNTREKASRAIAQACFEELELANTASEDEAAIATQPLPE